MIYLLEFDAYNVTTGQLERQRFANGDYTTKPGDTLPNVHFKNRIRNSGRYELSLFSSGQTQGDASVNYGFVELVNPDGGLDYLLNMPVDGRKLEISVVGSKDTPYADRMRVFSGTMEQLEMSLSIVTIRLRDRLAELAKPLQTLLYLGTTTAGGMGTAEGTPDDLKDKLKLMVWGKVTNVSPVLANRFDLIYHISTNPLASVDAVRDSGVPLTFAANYATLAALAAATIPAGRYGTCLATGHIKLAAEAAGDLTVDATEGANAAQRSPARIAQRMLTLAGFVAGTDFDLASFDAMHAAVPAPMGVFYETSEVEILAAINQVLGGAGIAIAPDQLGVFQLYRNDNPSTGVSVATIRKYMVLKDSLERVATSDRGKGVPTNKITLRYARNYTTQSASVLDETASSAIKAFAVEQWRNVVAQDAAVLVKHPLSPALDFDTCFVDAADANAEANRRLGLYGVRRDLYRLSLPLIEVGPIGVGKVVTLVYDRFGLEVGKKFLVVGLTAVLASNRVQFDLWG